MPEDAHLVVLAGHPVVALKAAASRFRQAGDDSTTTPPRSGPAADPACR
jgi:hypothetical protein